MSGTCKLPQALEVFYVPTQEDSAEGSILTLPLSPLRSFPPPTLSTLLMCLPPLENTAPGESGPSSSVLLGQEHPPRVFDSFSQQGAGMR